MLPPSSARSTGSLVAAICCAGLACTRSAASTTTDAAPQEQIAQQSSAAPSSHDRAPEPAVSVEVPADSAAPLVGAGASPCAAQGPCRGVWIWEFNKRAPSPQRAAEIVLRAGARRVFIKAGDGNEWDKWIYNANKRNLAPFVERGIEVWVFGYFYPSKGDVDGRKRMKVQIDAIMRAVSMPEVTGLVVDVEHEFDDRADAAERLCKGLRERMDGKPLTYTSFGWLSAHPRFPFQAFDQYCGDAFLPQVYYAFGWPGDIDGSLDRLEKEARDLGLRAPMWPIQSNEPDPSPERLRAFFERAGPDASVFHLHTEWSQQGKHLQQVRFR